MTWTKPRLVVPKQHSGGPQHAAGSCLRLSSPATGWKSEPQSKLYDTNFHHKWFWQNYCIFMKQFLQIHANTHMCKRTHTHKGDTHAHWNALIQTTHIHKQHTRLHTYTHSNTHTEYDTTQLIQNHTQKNTIRRTGTHAYPHANTLMRTENAWVTDYPAV